MKFVSIDVEKAFYESQQPFITKTLTQLGKKGKFLNFLKDIRVKPTADVT